MDVRKILKDLNYRIESSDKNDPEVQNAIRLRDRLLKRFGLSIDDITDLRIRREFGKFNFQESILVCQYFKKRLKTKFSEMPYQLEAYIFGTANKSKKNKNETIEINLTDEEYAKHKPIIDNYVKIFSECLKNLEKQLKKEAESKRKATTYAFFEKADLLEEADPNNNKKHSFNLEDAIRAARELDGMIFPEAHIKQEIKKLTTINK